MSTRACFLAACTALLLLNTGCIVVHDDHPPAPADEPATTPADPPPAEPAPVEPAPVEPAPVEPAPAKTPERRCPGCQRNILDNRVTECPDCETDLVTGKKRTPLPSKPIEKPVERKWAEQPPDEPPPAKEPPPPPPPPAKKAPAACPACGEQVLDANAKECPSCETPLKR